jgi:hypothetical protein
MKVHSCKMRSIEDYLERDNYIDYQCWSPDATRVLQVVELFDGDVVIQCTVTDEAGVTLTETLLSRDRHTFTIIGRWRHGADHHDMKSYPRDTKYPLYGRVKL